jgi:hypothetical protein
LAGLGFRQAEAGGFVCALGDFNGFFGGAGE